MATLPDIASAEALIGNYREAGGFDLPAPAPGASLRAIEKRLDQWCRCAEPTLQRHTLIPLDRLVRLLGCYDIAHRIGRHRPPSGRFMRDVRLAIVQRWARGEKTVTDTTIASLLAPEVSRGITTLDTRYTDCYYMLIDSWVRELERHGHFSGLPPAEARERLELLMAEPLSAHFPTAAQARAAKQRWATHA